jgi:hypothetical protein
MKCKFVFVLGALIALSFTVAGQHVEEINQVILYSKIGHHDWSRAAVNFETGARGSPYWKLTDFDLIYGTMAVNGDSDWFMVANPKSMIVDLGVKQWGDFKETPAFFKDKKPRKPQPLDTPIEIDVSAGSKEVSPYKQVVRVQAGHMYLMKVMRERTATYVMFRVDNLLKQDNCLLTWRMVAPPDDVTK